MAGVKVTDLPVLGTAAADDVLYIVDTSDDTSKQIELSNLGTSLGVESGVFTSDVITQTGFNLITVYEGIWTKIGNTIQYGCKIVFILNPTGIGLDQNGEFVIDFPEKINFFSEEKHSFQLTINENNPNTFNKSIVYGPDLNATININSIGTGGDLTGGVLYLTAFYTY